MKAILILFVGFSFCVSVGFAEEQKIEELKKLDISKLNETIERSQLGLRCFEQMHGEVICKVGEPCGPFYKDRSDVCIQYRAHVLSVSANKLSKIETAPTNIRDIEFSMKCLKQAHGEILCTLGEPCGPFYEDNSPACVSYRRQINKNVDEALKSDGQPAAASGKKSNPVRIRK